MKNKNLLHNILDWVGFVLFLAAGAAVLALKFLYPNNEVKILGTIILIAGFAKLAVYLLVYLKKNPRSVLFISAAAFIVLGFIYTFSGYDYELLCFGWGIVDIVLGVVEIFTSAFELKEDKMQWFEMAIATGGMVFGILLTIELAHGLNAHIIYLGISLILLGALIAAEKVIEKVRGHEE